MPDESISSRSSEPDDSRHRSTTYYDMSSQEEHTIVENEMMTRSSNNDVVLESPPYIPDSDSITPYGIVPNPDNNFYDGTNAYLLITDKNGRTSHGSAFTIGPNHFGTCGHNLKNSAFGQDNWAYSVLVIPAMRSNGTRRKPTAYANNLQVGGDWGSSWDYYDDWGIVVTRTDIGRDTGWLGVRYVPSSLMNTGVYAYGYQGGNALYKNEGDVLNDLYHPRSLIHNGAVYSGMSGGATTQLDYYIIGFNKAINTNGLYPGRPESIKFDRWLYDKYTSYR